MNIEQEDPRLGRALHAMEQGKVALSVSQYLGEYLRSRQRQLDKELFEAPPEGWDHIIRQKIEAHRFVQNLSQLMKAGESSAKLLSPMLGQEDE